MTLEDKEQCAFVKAYKLRFPKYLMWHTPNGGYRNVAEAAKFKRMGVLAGVPDIFIPIPKKDKHGMFIELKTKNGKVSKSQNEMIEKLIELDYAVAVCHGWEAAFNASVAYLTQ